MSKQKKSPIPPPFNFFEDMEEKMQIEDSKRRKLSKKKLHSQPELLFLQFNPNGGTDFCSFGNKAYSQSSGSNSHKRSWQPPVKVSNEFGIPLLDQSLTKEKSSRIQLLNENNENINLSCTDNYIEESLIANNSQSGSNNIINYCNELEHFDTISQLPVPTNVEKILDAKQILEKDNENVYSHCIKNLSEEEKSSVIISSDNLKNDCLDKEISFKSMSQSNAQNINIETDSKQTIKECCGESGENLGNCEDVICHEPTQPSFDNYRYNESEYKQKIDVDKESCSHDETKNLDILKVLNKERMSTQRNLNNGGSGKLERTVEDRSGNYISNNDNNNFDENCENIICHESTPQPSYDNYRYSESECKQIIDVDKESCSHDETKNLDILKVLNTERISVQKNLNNGENSKLERTDDNRLRVENTNINYSEHEDILNSIDMILSEGCDNSPEPQEFRKNVNEDKKQGQKIEEIVMKSKFENGYNLKSVDNEPNVNATLVCEKISNLSKIENQLKNEIPKERLLKTETEKLPEKTVETHLTNSIEKQIEVIEDTEITSNAIDSTYNKDNSEINMKEINANDHPGSNDEAESVNDIIQYEGEPTVDDEYSCAMISTSQLLEIERKYNETLKSAKCFKFSQVSIKETSSNILNSTEPRRTVSVGTQTEHFYSQPSVFTQQNVLPPVPPVQWTSKMLESQRKLRDIIQEIERLNVILLKARQEIWPQRKNTENIPGYSKQDNASFNLCKKK